MNFMNIRRGEICLVNLDPTLGAEIKKTRPTIIISSNALGKLPLKLVVPVTDWKEYFTGNLWHIYIEPTITTGLKKKSTADVLQMRSIDTRRCIYKLGVVPDITLRDITIAIANLIEYEEIL